MKIRNTWAALTLMLVTLSCVLFSFTTTQNPPLSMQPPTTEDCTCAYSSCSGGGCVCNNGWASCGGKSEGLVPGGPSNKITMSPSQFRRAIQMEYLLRSFDSPESAQAAAHISVMLAAVLSENLTGYQESLDALITSLNKLPDDERKTFDNWKNWKKTDRPYKLVDKAQAEEAPRD
jgi:hypothetical protein